MRVRHIIPGHIIRKRNHSGQALMETVLVLPLLLTLVLNAVNFAYFFLIALNITGAARNSGTYSIMGLATPASINLPADGPNTTPTSVSYLAYQDLTGALNSPLTSASVQVCSPYNGINNAGTLTQNSICTHFGSITSFPAAATDPELNAGNTAPAFNLNRVDVADSFSPPIPFTPFNILVLVSPACTSSGGTVTCTFYRHVEMRAMN